MTDRYEFVKLLGEGGAGSVFKAWDSRLQRHVAVKRLLPAHAREGIGVGTDLGSEAATLAAFQHPNVVAVYDLDFLGDEPCIIMEYLNGETLQEILVKGALTLSDFFGVTFHSLEAMEAAHRMGIEHRDIKPSNFMIQWTPNGKFVLKMVDFGISEIAHRPTTKIDSENVYGSVYYLAPEQFSSGPIDHRADLYSLGCVLYSCLTTEHPFQGEGLLAVRDAHIAGHVNPALSLRPDVPQAVKDFVLKLMARNPEERYQNATAAKADFSAIQSLRPNTTAPVQRRAPAGTVSTTTRTVQAEASGVLTITQKLKRLPNTQRFLYAAGAAAVLVGAAAAFNVRKKPAVETDSAPVAQLQSKLEGPVLSPPKRSSLKMQFIPGVDCLNENGTVPAHIDGPVGFWKDQASAGGKNELHYLAEPGDKFKLARLPILINSKFGYGIAEGTPVVRFDGSNLYLFNDASDSERPWNSSNREVLTNPQTTFAMVVRARSHNRGVLLGGHDADADITWELWAENGNYHLGRSDKPECTARLAIPDVTTGVDQEASAKFNILICEVNTAGNKGRIMLASASDPEEIWASASGFNTQGMVTKMRLGSRASQPEANIKNGKSNIEKGFSGDFAELLVYDTLLTETERGELVGYLRNRHFQ